MEQIESTLQNMWGTFLEKLTQESPEEAFLFLEHCKTLADKTGIWKHRVEARLITLKTGPDLDLLDQTMADLVWIAGQWEMHPDNTDLSKGMWAVQRNVEYLAGFPDVQPAQVEMVLRTLEQWAKTEKDSPHYLQLAQFRTYQKLGMPETAETYKAALLDLEAREPFSADAHWSCRGCAETDELFYYTSLGMTGKALDRVARYLDGGQEPPKCFTAPRAGMACLVDALVDAGQGAGHEAAQAAAVLLSYLDFPFKAPLRMVVPLLRYYMVRQELDAAEQLIRAYLPIAQKTRDTWSARRFYQAASEHPAMDQASLRKQALELELS